jgi:hypothetical protein
MAGGSTISYRPSTKYAAVIVPPVGEWCRQYHILVCSERIHSLPYNANDEGFVWSYIRNEYLRSMSFKITHTHTSSDVGNVSRIMLATLQ